MVPFVSVEELPRVGSVVGLDSIDSGIHHSHRYFRRHRFPRVIQCGDRRLDCLAGQVGFQAQVQAHIQKSPDRRHHQFLNILVQPGIGQQGGVQEDVRCVAILYLHLHQLHRTVHGDHVPAIQVAGIDAEQDMPSGGSGGEHDRCRFTRREGCPVQKDFHTTGAVTDLRRLAVGHPYGGGCGHRGDSRPLAAPLHAVVAVFFRGEGEFPFPLGVGRNPGVQDLFRSVTLGLQGSARTVRMRPDLFPAFPVDRHGSGCLHRTVVAVPGPDIRRHLVTGAEQSVDRLQEHEIRLPRHPDPAGPCDFPAGSVGNPGLQGVGQVLVAVRLGGERHPGGAVFTGCHGDGLHHRPGPVVRHPAALFVRLVEPGELV